MGFLSLLGLLGLSSWLKNLTDGGEKGVGQGLSLAERIGTKHMGLRDLWPTTPS